MHYKLFIKEGRQWLVVCCWLVAALMGALYLPYAGQPFKIENLSDPKAESTIAQKDMENKFPFSGSRVIVLYKSNKLKADHSDFITQVNKSLDGVKKLSFEHRVISPYKNPQQIADNEKVAYAVIETEMNAEALANLMDDIKEELGEPKNLKMYVGGEPAYTADVNQLSEDNLRRGELIALPIAFIAMIFIFSGFLAALLTVFVGVVNIIIITAILYLLGHQMDLTVFVINIANLYQR